MINELAKKEKDKPFDKYDSEFANAVASIQNKVTDIIKFKNWSDNEKVNFKTNAVRELEKFISNIKKM